MYVIVQCIEGDNYRGYASRTKYAKLEAKMNGNDLVRSWNYLDMEKDIVRW